MDKYKELKTLALLLGIFAFCYFLPVGTVTFDKAILESLHLLKWYAREHVVLCLVPAFFIAGAIGVFVSQASVMKYLGAKANKVLAYCVASVSGTILAVCSCTVLPLFGGIYKMGAGIGPACAFLYSGPAINVLAIALTARVLGFELGLARAIGAVLFSVLIGLIMSTIFGDDHNSGIAPSMGSDDEDEGRSLLQNGLYFASMVAILVFANFGSDGSASGVWYEIASHKWHITIVFSLLFALILAFWFKIGKGKVLGAVVVTGTAALLFPTSVMVPFITGIGALSYILVSSEGEERDWVDQTWGFTKQIIPLLFGGVLIAGLLIGRPGSEGLIPVKWISDSVGGNSFGANFFASVAGAFMYFATLTEIPILSGLIGAGMGKGPALAMLLAGPALSLPNMLVIRSIMGTKKTLVFVTLVVAMSTVAGMLFGMFYGG
jgi:hypothetical protein